MTSPVDLLKGLGLLQKALRSRALSPPEAVEASLQQIERIRHLNAAVEVREEAIAEAASASGRLAGVPVVVKDAFVDRGRPPSVGSRLRAEWLSGTATVLERLRAAGAVIVAYANLHEWMVGTTSQVSAFGPIGNPRDASLVAGGSSGGSAAALAAGAAPLAIGTDAGGSIRVPAACCGVVGFKPTWGLVPTSGFVDDGSLIDHVGPMGRSVGDVRVMLEVLTGATIETPPVEGMRVGMVTDGPFADVDPEVAGVVRASFEALGPHVSQLVDVELGTGPNPGVAPFILRDVALMLSEHRHDWQDLLQEETRKVLAIGAAFTETERAEAISGRAETIGHWDALFDRVDAVVTPTLPGRVATVGSRSISLPSGRVSAEVAYVRASAGMNLAGVPSLSVPCGELPDGQSVNVSISAARGRDGVALAVGECLEQLGLSTT